MVIVNVEDGGEGVGNGFDGDHFSSDVNVRDGVGDIVAAVHCHCSVIVLIFVVTLVRVGGDVCDVDLFAVDVDLGDCVGESPSSLTPLHSPSQTFVYNPPSPISLISSHNDTQFVQDSTRINRSSQLRKPVISYVK